MCLVAFSLNTTEANYQWEVHTTDNITVQGDPDEIWFESLQQTNENTQQENVSITNLVEDVEHSLSGDQNVNDGEDSVHLEEHELIDDLEVDMPNVEFLLPNVEFHLDMPNVEFLLDMPKTRTTFQTC
ncbi:hypothetical protein L2E82_17052 [Cichorium intybus]|uniref:Uncharacterized protein n=1 Tax=Cichorium intybus TaxID=13427 RepID=A0ACB9F7P2_CICIN|nr:hypothetical protein L2E82_17052 [Cichorium intybus]